MNEEPLKALPKPNMTLIAFIAVALVVSAFFFISKSSGRSVHEPDPNTTTNPSITGAMLEGNPSKYVGERVQLDCKVLNVIGAEANITCDGDGAYNVLLLEGKEGDISDLDADQHIIVNGFVDDPQTSKTAMGGERTFALVYAERLSKP
jgi:hypothetical protein